MSVQLNPSGALGFKRPLTQLAKRSLIITNHNQQPIAFKVKTTAPKLYCVRPNSGRVEPGDSIDVSVMLQALREEPPSNAKCKDKFLIQSTLITAEKETLPLQDIWNVNDGVEDSKVFQQKLRVTYLPAEGQPVEEEEEPRDSYLHPNGAPLQYGTVRERPAANGRPQQPDFQATEPPPPPSFPQDTPVRPSTPPADYNMAPQYSQDSSREAPAANTSDISIPVPASPAVPVPPVLTSDSDLEYVTEPPRDRPRTPEPIPVPPIVVPAPIHESPNIELLAKYQAAQAEINRLRATLATMEESSAELRRRRPALSDDDGSIAGTDVATVVDDGHFQHQQEGVPLQVVVIIALGVFITTYLFF